MRIITSLCICSAADYVRRGAVSVAALAGGHISQNVTDSPGGETKVKYSGTY